MTPRVYIIGTDTGVGKTSFCCALLRAAGIAGLPLLPYKPAVSGNPGPDSDTDRLLAASALSLTIEELSPLRYDEPLAPGIADDPRPFLEPTASRSNRNSSVPEAVPNTLRGLEDRFRPVATVIEGAGGLEVPMPGGTWQIDWIHRLSARPLLVARSGLGTINHTLLSIAALRSHDLEPLGFVTVDVSGTDDPSRELNAQVIARRGVLPHLAHLGHSDHASPDADPWLTAALSPNVAQALWRTLAASTDA